MADISPELLQVGALGIILIFAIREFFAYLKSRRNGKNGITKIDNQQAIDIAVLKEKIINFETNCFPTINKKLDRLEEKLDKLLQK